MSRSRSAIVPGGRLSLVASPKGGDGALTNNQDVELYVGTIGGGKLIEKEIEKSRKAYVHVARGEVSLNGTDLKEGDGAKIVDEQQLKLSAPEDAEVLLFDLP